MKLTLISTGENFYKRWGFCDSYGNMVIEPLYIDAKPFSEGLAAVAVYVENGIRLIKKWGFINENGNVIIPFIYNTVNSFQNGVSEVYDEFDLKCVLDNNGIKVYTYPVAELKQISPVFNNKRQLTKKSSISLSGNSDNKILAENANQISVNPDKLGAGAFDGCDDFISSDNCYEISGNNLAVAELWIECGQHGKAAKCYEKTGEYRKAAECYAKAGEHRKAAECYEKAGAIDKATEYMLIIERRVRKKNKLKQKIKKKKNKIFLNHD